MLRLVVAAGLLVAARAEVDVVTREFPHQTIAEEFRDLPASFGPELPDEGLRGLLVHGVPPDGCAVPAPPPKEPGYNGNWILLVARYNCNFETKVRNAQTAGYHCVIVHNVNSSDLETMSAKDPQGIAIPSVFVSDIAGYLLAEEYNYTSGFEIMVNSDLPFNINTHLLLPFAIVVVLCLLVILIFMIVKCIKDRRRARRHRLPNRSLRKIPTCKFNKSVPYDTCAICLDDYQDGDRLRVLPCAHAYHAKCIDPWLTQNRRVCPVCKRRVMLAGERRPPRDDHSDSDDSSRELITQPVNTEGGTFDSQTENPFVRAARFMARLRRRGNDSEEVPPETPPSEEEIDPNGNNEIHHTEEESAPLLPPPSPLAPPAAVRAESERARRGRSGRRGRTGRPPHAHSINDGQGEIGVAALPAPSLSSSVPHDVNL